MRKKKKNDRLKETVMEQTKYRKLNESKKVCSNN